MLYFVDTFMTGSQSSGFQSYFEVEPEQLKEMMLIHGWRSHIHSKEKAKLLSRVLGVKIEVNKTTLNLDHIDNERDGVVVFEADQLEDLILIRFYVLLPRKKMLML
jgi:hypothetical protein